MTTFFGGWIPQRIVVIEFPSQDDMARCFTSPEYREIEHLRLKSTKGSSIVVEGFTG